MTLSEEDYLKAIYHLSKENQKGISTNAIAERMQTKASSVTEMIKKLAEKGMVLYKPYQGVKLTEAGTLRAARIVRKHRLWEVFLVEKLEFGWDQVHDIAEELEHIRSEELTDRLDAFLNYPTVDPHGDPIPDRSGNLKMQEKLLVAHAKPGTSGTVVGVKNSSDDFLRYLDKLGIALGIPLEVVSKEPFDHSMQVLIRKDTVITLSAQAAHNIYLTI